MNEYVILGGIGGVIFDFFQLLELRNKPKEERPDVRDWLYWLPYIVWPILSGLLVYVYDSPDLRLNKLISLQLGVSAPLIFRQMLKSNPLSARYIRLQDENQ